MMGWFRRQCRRVVGPRAVQADAMDDAIRQTVQTRSQLKQVRDQLDRFKDVDDQFRRVTDLSAMALDRKRRAGSAP